MQWPLPQFPTQTLPPVAVDVTGSSTAGAKGSWVTIISEIPFETGWIALGTYLQTSVGGGNTATSLDLGCDGTVVVADLLLGHRHRYCTMFPLRLPAGATLQARVGGELANRRARIYVQLFGGEPDTGLAAPMLITTYGATTSGGLQLVPGTSVDKTDWSWHEVTASTVHPIHALMVLVQGWQQFADSAHFALDVGIGPAGSETVIIPDHRFFTVASDDYVSPASPQFYPLAMAIPAGTRLAVRGGRVEDTVSGTTNFEVGLYGFTY